MNAYTTIEESKALVEAGLDPKTADMYYSFMGEHIKEAKLEEFTVHVGEAYAIKGNHSSYQYGYVVPCWSLAALLNIIENNGLVYDISNDKNREFEILVYEANYTSQEVKFHHTEHSIVDIIIWLLNNNYIKSNKSE